MTTDPIPLLDFILAAESGDQLTPEEFVTGIRDHADALQRLQGSWQGSVAFIRAEYPELFETDHEGRPVWDVVSLDEDGLVLTPREHESC